MAEQFTYTQVQEYLTTLVPARPAEVVRMEAYAEEHHFPIIGPVAGQMCYQMARMIGARRIFELGSGYGYSTAWFAKAVQENLALSRAEGSKAEGGGGEVHHVVWDDQLSNQARQHLNALGYGAMIRYHSAEAVETLRNTAGPFDLIFNDIDKHGYPASLPVIEEKLRSGGVLIIDNTIWSGRVLDDSDQSENTQGVREVTRILTTSPNWITSLFPLRDGLLVAMKK